MGSVLVKGVKLYYSKTGRGPPLIFLHGVFFESSLYTKLIRLLAKRFTVYAIDVPMHGKSSSPRHHVSMSDMAELIYEFTKAKKIRKPTLCAHSAGCLIAMEFAAKHPVKQLVLMDPAGVQHYRSKSMFMNRLVGDLFVNLFSHPLKTTIMATTALATMKKNRSNDIFQDFFDENYNKNFARIMKKITCPTLLLWAKHDHVLDPALAKKFQQYIKNTTFFLVDGYHGWPIYSPNKIKKYLDKLL